MVNGKASLICNTPLTDELTLQTLRGSKIIKDLVVDGKKGSK